MSSHIGIVACSAEGAALCYRTICAEGPPLLGPHAHPEISMHTPSLARYVRCLNDGDWPGVAELMLTSAAVLAGAGADFLICPDNSIHQAMNLVLPRSPLPWLHIADVVADTAVERGMRRVGLLGTRWLLSGDVYPSALRARGLECVLPAQEDAAAIHRIIIDELTGGTAAPASVARHQQVIAGLREAGCEGVILGCTEIPLIITDANSPLPTLDSTRLLARAALRRAVSEPAAGR
jgi:aspartate racemase